ncbi:response regulator [Candidatus Ferrigenium straubiae]|jgi:DNA-binding NarL/FixJ family response regulator|uniref:response regulator n=1 Tax=Candidatus Ferrigenium straubiae TaxID=2919506 RepID=UPI003F4A8F44
MIRILIADDHAIVRSGLRQLLFEQGDFIVEGEAANGVEMLRLLREQPFDVALMDMSMPGRSGTELVRLAKAEKPKLAILVLSMHKEEQYAVRALKAGASGYMTKESAPDQLVAAIRKVAGGGVFISPGVAERLALELGCNHNPASHTLLSDREYQIFRMIVAGMPVGGIADELSLSVKTISTHKTRILQKMKMASSAELIHYAIRHQLVEMPGDL